MNRICRVTVMAIPLHAFVTTRFDTHRWPESIPVAGASLVEGHDGFAANILNCRAGCTGVSGLGRSADRAPARRDGGEHRGDNGEIDSPPTALALGRDAEVTGLAAG